MNAPVERLSSALANRYRTGGVLGAERWILIACTVVLALAKPHGMLAQVAVPVYEEPRHQVMLDSVGFRVLAVEISPGDTTLFHTHEDPAIYIFLGASPIDTQVQGASWAGTSASSAPAWAAGDVLLDSSYAAAPLTHRVTNLGTRPFRLLMITSAGASGAPAAQPQPDVPGTHESASTWFVQARLKVEPQGTSGAYRTEAPLLIVNPLDGALQVELDSGASSVLAPSGGWLLIPPGVRYRLTNAGSNEAVALLVAIRR